MRLFLALLLATTTSAQSIDPKAVDRTMNAMVKAWSIPGAAVAVVQNDRVLHVQGYGVKEAGGTEPVTADTLFQIASTTKAFTTTALAMLASDGKLSFDDPVRKHVPYFRLHDVCADGNVTLRDIVSHRTGLESHDSLWDDTTLTREQVIRSLGRIQLAQPFRTTYQYHNIMFIAAGEAVAGASGMSWDEFVRTRIFQPLKMTSTVTSQADWIRADHATGHRYDWKSGVARARTADDVATLGSGGAIKSSARDLANWVRFHLADGAFEGRQLLDAEQLEETKTPQMVRRMSETTAALNPETHLLTYAMGWNVQDYRGEKLVWHSGSLNGFRTQVILMPRRKTGFVVMINAERGYGLYALRNTLADMVIGSKPHRDWNAYYLGVDRTEEERSEKTKQARMAKRIPDTTPTRPLAEYAGEYTNEAYGPVNVRVVDSALTLQWNRHSAPLTHYHYDLFDATVGGYDETVSFALDDEKKVKSLSLFGQTFVRRPARIP
jgi:CubicO group peptidase (beta-lactamase class C family)